MAMVTNMSKIKNPHISGALATVLNRGNIETVSEKMQREYKKESCESSHAMTEEKDVVLEVNPETIKNWEFHDRPESELKNLNELAKEFIEIGQQQPCLVRKSPLGSKEKYELIIGERRWRAAKIANIKLKVIVKDYDDNSAALAQIAENDSRENLSDFAKGMSYYNLIEIKKIITRKELMEKLGKSKQYISALLSFGSIPKNIIDAIGDMSLITGSTAERIKQLSQKGNEYINIIIGLSDKIRTGKISRTMLDKKVNAIISETNGQKSISGVHAEKVHTIDGRHIFTVRTDNNQMPSIHFPKQITELFKTEKIQLNELVDEFNEVITKKIKNIVGAESPL